MPTLPSAGEVFAGKYRIDGRLGRGGHGAVFRAKDLHLGNAVALKVLLPEQLDGVGRDRFRREAELGERLKNPHSVRLYAYGEDDKGQPYIAFELLEGQSLSHYLEAHGPQSPQTVAGLARAVLEALAEAHELGMVHRDIKPANIHLCEYAGQAGFVKVLDFGIAKRSARDATQLTATDVVVGTARYMAPEQLRGDEISPATDLYSLGLVMAEMLTGAPVFQGSTIEICMEQVSADRVPLPDAVRSSPLGRAIERATDKRRERRYPTARAMLQDLPSSTPATLIEFPEGDEETALMPPGEAPRPADFQPAGVYVPSSTPAMPAGGSGGYPAISVPASSPAFQPPTQSSPAFNPGQSSPGFQPPMQSSPGFQPPMQSSQPFQPPMQSSPVFNPGQSSPGFQPPMQSSPAFNPGQSSPGFQPPMQSSPALSMRLSSPSYHPVHASHPSIPPTSGPLPSSMGWPEPAQKRQNGALWALGLLTAFLLLAALIAAGAWLVHTDPSVNEPPPMPTRR